MGFDWETYEAGDGHLSLRQVSCKDCVRLRETLWAVNDLFADLLMESANEGLDLYNLISDELYEKWVEVQEQLTAVLSDVKKEYLDPYHRVDDLPEKKQ
jgi:hypothetical protein